MEEGSQFLSFCLWILTCFQQDGTFMKSPGWVNVKFILLKLAHVDRNVPTGVCGAAPGFSASHTTRLLPRVCFFFFSSFFEDQIPNCGICSPPRDHVRMGCGEQQSLWWAEPPPIIQLLFLLAEIQGPTLTHALNMKPLGAAESAPRASTNAQGEYWRTST